MINGVDWVMTKDGTAMMTQEKRIDKLKVLTTEEGFRSQRVLAQFIGAICRPNIFATVQLIAPANANVKERQFKSKRTAINHMHEKNGSGLDFNALDIQSVRIVMFSNASFANAASLKSQLGFVVPMVSKHRGANIVHHGSSLSHRITKWVTAAEVHALGSAFDQGYSVREAPEELLERQV